MLVVDVLLAACKSKDLVCKRVNSIFLNVHPSIYHKKKAFLSMGLCLLLLY